MRPSFCAPCPPRSRYGRHGGRVVRRSLARGDDLPPSSGEGATDAPLVAVPGRGLHDRLRYAWFRSAPSADGHRLTAGVRCVCSLMRSRAARTGGPLSGARGALPVRFTGPEKERHETPSGLHRHGTGLVSTPCVVRDLVRAACRATSTPPYSDSGRSDQQGHLVLCGRPRQPARSRQPKPPTTGHPHAWHSAIPFALSRCESSCPSGDERSPNVTSSGAHTMTCR